VIMKFLLFEASLGLMPPFWGFRGGAYLEFYFIAFAARWLLFFNCYY
jgi:hypothetical protein